METTMVATGLLVARLVFGTVMMGHGVQKLFGWLGGHGLQGTAGFFEQLGFRPGIAFATVASLNELVSGLLLVLGLFTPFASGVLIAGMLVAIGTVHWKNGLFAQNNGIEVPLLYATFAVALALTGPGAYSLDAAAGIKWSPAVVVIALTIGVVGGMINLAIRNVGWERHVRA